MTDDTTTDGIQRNLRHRDMITVAVDGEELEVYNHVTVTQEHHLRPGDTETFTGRIHAGDGGIGPPDAVTAWLAEDLWHELGIDLDNYGIERIDVESDGVDLI